MTPLPLLATAMLLPAWFNPEWLLNAMGNWALWGVALIIFLECGLFPILPGDSLLFTVGMFVAIGTISYGDPWLTLLIVLPVLTVAAVMGNVTGYWFGYLIGPPLFQPRPGRLGKIFDPKYVVKSHEFFERHGLQALVLARFVPLVRTFVTVVAGVGRMHFPKFIFYTGIGGVIWVTLAIGLGFFLGQLPIVRDNVEATLIAIVLVSLLPMGIGYLRQKTSRSAA